MDNNIQNIQLLKKVIETDKKTVAIIGSGASYFIGIPTWDELLERMKTEFGCTDINIKESILKQGYPKTASIIYDKKGDSKLYIDFLCRQCTPTRGSFDSLHMQLINVFKKILTTNFDTCFENAYKNKCHPNKPRINIHCLPDFNIDKLSYNNNLVYLHGHKKKKVFIFKEEEYKNFYPTYYNTQNSSDLEEFLKIIFQIYNLVFIGFSFNDKAFVKYLRHVIQSEIKQKKDNFENLYGIDYPRKVNKHRFVIISDEELSLEIQDQRKLNENKERDTLFKDLDFKVITIRGQNFNDIGKILEDIMERKYRVKKSTRGMAYV